MVLFFIKKVFFDAWDNLLTIVLFNIGFSIIIAVSMYTAFLFEPAGLGYFISIIAGICIFNFYGAAVSGYMNELLNDKKPELKQFPLLIKKYWKSAAAISTVSIFQIAALVVGFPFYFSIGGLPGLVGLVTLFWITIFWWITVQYFLPVSTQLETNLKKQFKKSFILLLDNTFFSFFLGLYTVVILGISFFTALLIPGITVVLLAHQVTLKLRLYKYDYLEENNENNRKNIPWAELLYEEKERIGQRTIKGMIFPWKE